MIGIFGKCCTPHRLSEMRAVALVLGLLAACAAADTHWEYFGHEGFDKWPEEFPTCNGSHQSPINVDPFFSSAGAFEPFYFSYYHEIPQLATVTNNGHSLEVKIKAENQPKVSGGNLGGTYTFDQYHVHWGADDLRGSEHTINHVRYPMELHLVHHKSDYANISAALEHPDGLAVLSLLFVISENDNPSLAPLISQLANNKNLGAQNLTADLYPLTSVLPKDLSRFYRYRGSLTTPKCNEVVTWTIFDDHVPVSEKQMKSIRSLQDSVGSPLLNNFRPTQPLNGRIVYRSFLK